MRGVMMYGPGDVRVEDRADPAIQEPTDAVIRLSATCVCGSDLWAYRGQDKVNGPAPMGHEYAGIVEEVGPAVRDIRPGQFVVGSFFASDNTCEICQAGYQSSCVHRVPVGAIGTQSQYARIPLADGTLVAAPEAPSDDLVPGLLAASDVLGTGWFGAVAADVQPGKTVAVVGDGAVGLLAILADLRRSAAEQVALRRVATLVARGAARAEVFEALVTEVGLLIPATDAALVRLHGDETVTMIGRWNESGGYQEIGVQHPFGSGTLARLIWDSKHPCRVTTYTNASGSLAGMIRGWGWRSSVGAPVIVDGTVWGLTAVGSTNDQTLPPETEAQLAAFTELLAIAIANEQSREELEQLAAEQAALRRVAELAVHDAPPDEVLEAVVTEASRLVGVAFTTLLRFEADGATEVVAIHDPPDGVTVGMRASGDGDGATQRVWRTRRPARVDQLSAMSGAWPQVAARHGFSSSAAAPILAADRLWGALVAAGRGSLPTRIEEQLSRFAELAGTAIASSQARADVQALADEQAALLRVAEQVARGGPPDAVFAAVAAEAQQLLGGQPMTLVRFEEDAALVVLSRSGGPAPPGTRIAYTSGSLPDRVRRTGRPERVDDYGAEPDAALAREFALTAAVAAPIAVESRVWGMLTATSAGGPLARGVEDRLQRFANLAGTAVSNAASRAQLIASRARVLSTADETRRRLQRDVHDGAQQRLVQTVITLKLARQSLADHDVEAGIDRVEEALKHAQRATDELRELARGILPARLTRKGLRGGVESLLADLPLPVDAVVDMPRLPAEIETTAYFVVAEALTNVVKHARASRAWVRASLSAGAVHVEVGDDGVGGAQAGAGSGLTGLFDRVEARGGALRITSPAGGGTTVEATVPVGEPLPSTPGMPR